MNLYGDIGNITVLQKRAEARGIEVSIDNFTTNDTLISGQTDIYFFGGGQDAQQVEIGEDLLKKKQSLLEDLNNNTPILAICGGYQLLGRYYLTGDKKRAEGVGFFPIETISPSTLVNQRCIGNISVKIINDQTREEIKKFYKYTVEEDLLLTLTGFENHSGRTRLLSDENLHLGKVTQGFGDSEIQGYEGIRYKNAFGSYMHGSFLPKNPHMADLILSLALSKKYKSKFEGLSVLDDKIEWEAHKYALNL